MSTEGNHTPEAKQTLQIPKAQLDALNAAIAEGHKASTNEIVGALDRAVSALMKRADETDQRIDQLRSDVRTWLFGDGDVRPGIAQDLGLTREQTDSALAAIGGMTTRLESLESQSKATLRVACASYTGIFQGPDKVSDEEREACETIRDAARSAG